MAETGRPKRIFYGRRQGRPLRAGRQRLLAELLPRLRVQALPGLEPKCLFQARPESVWLELGFGGGEHLAALAKANSGAGFIGAEPFLSGVASLLSLIETDGLANIRIYPEDGRDLLEALASASLAGCYVLFPDPWPKLRHHKRRLISPETVDELARVVADGGLLALASDDADYVEWMREILTQHPLWRGLRFRPEETQSRPEGWIASRYEAKALAKGVRPHYLMFQRRDRREAAK